MGCCGGKIKKVASAVSSIAAGNAGYMLGRIFSLPTNKCPETSQRTRICQQCDDNTWLTKEEVFDWVKTVGLKKITAAFADKGDLTQLPPFDKKPYRPKTKLMCTRCKCFIPAKVRVKDKKCPLGKWADI